MKSATFSPRLFRLVAAVLGCALTLAAPLSGRAQDTAMPTILHSFDVTEGDTPGQLVLGSDGNFYGTTAFGGFGYTTFQNYAGDGTVYRITPAGDYATLYAFPGGAQGQNPYALIQGIDGNFYGLTGYFGVAGDSTVFRLTPAGEMTTVYTFPAGAFVSEPLVQDDSGNFYGARSPDNDTGTNGSIFRLAPSGEYTTLYAFTGGGDGGESSGLIKGGDGNFYGTSDRGTEGIGTIFRITPAGGLTVLHTFTGTGGGNGLSGLTPGSDGNLYGTIAAGGVNSKGVVFRLTLTGDYTVLYAFTGGSDGEYPGGRLVEGSDGNFYGLTSGTTEPTYQPSRRTAEVDPIGTGMPVPAQTPVPATVFRITPQGVLTSLYASSIDFSGFILGGDGNFYGTDDDDEGEVFKLSIVSHPAFFTNQAPLTDGTYYLSFSNGNYFGYYTFQSDPNYLYHLDLGPEYFIDAKDGQEGLYLYDFRSSGFFYTSPTFPFPYLYDFNLKSAVYYFPDPNNAGRYTGDTADGVRYFYDFGTGTVISK